MRGHIVKRYASSWSIVLDLGRDPTTGKRRQQWVSVKGTKRDAERKMSELLHQVDAGGFVKPAKLTVGEFLRQWLRDYVAINVRPKTAEGYAHNIERHLIPRLGNIRLSGLQAAHLQGFYAEALQGGRLDGKGGLSTMTLLHLHRTLSEALSHAVKWGLLARNVALALDAPRPQKQEMATLDSDGVRKLLKEAKGSAYYPLLHLAIYTGMRRSELLALRWKDLDLDLATLSVVRVVHHLREGDTVYQEPKTAKGKRLVALSPSAALALRAHRERQEGERYILGLSLTTEDLVFSHPDGSPLLPNTVTHAFIKIARRAGLGGIRLHDLRHTHATLMLKQGVHPKIVSERLGYATVGITLDRYSHVVPGLQESAALRFDEALANPSPALNGHVVSGIG